MFKRRHNSNVCTIKTKCDADSQYEHPWSHHSIGQALDLIFKSGNDGWKRVVIETGFILKFISLKNWPFTCDECKQLKWWKWNGKAIRNLDVLPKGVGLHKILQGLHMGDRHRSATGFAVLRFRNWLFVDGDHMQEMIHNSLCVFPHRKWVSSVGYD